MLKQIKCDLFTHQQIDFQTGLNVILGDDEAKNSIGKSSALLAIDFAMGGSSLLIDKAGVIKKLGHHIYRVTFKFAGKPLYVSRSTDEPEIVKICNSNHVVLNEISVEDYKALLKKGGRKN